ncbi:hypothetical protein [Rubinisphaera sp.]
MTDLKLRGMLEDTLVI